MSVWTRKTSGAYITKLTSHQPPESELELSEPEISTEQPTHWQPIDPVGSQVRPRLGLKVPLFATNHARCFLYSILRCWIALAVLLVILTRVKPAFLISTSDCRRSTKLWRVTTRSTTWRRRTPSRTRTRSRRRRGRRWSQREVSNLSRRRIEKCLTTVDKNWSFTFRHVTHHVPRHWNHHWQLHCDDPHRDHRAESELLSNVSFTIDKTWKLWRQRSNLFFF